MSSPRSVFDIAPLSPEEEEKILASAGYTKSRLAEDLAILRSWIEQQPHFPPSSRTENDNFLTNYLIGCKRSIEWCKRKLDGYYSWRRRSIIFADRNPLSTMDIYDSVTMVLMPKCLPTGYRLSFLRFETSKGFDVMTLCRQMAFCMDLRTRFMALSLGDTIVIDCENFSAAYLPSFSPTVLRDMILFVQDAIATRCDQYYFINCPPLAETVFNKMMRPFMNKKMSARVPIENRNNGLESELLRHLIPLHDFLELSAKLEGMALENHHFTQTIHISREATDTLVMSIKQVSREGKQFLHQKFPKEVLPSEYGGDGPSMKSIQEKRNRIVREMAMDDEDTFISSISQLTDESRRPKDSPFRFDESLFGVQGTIKSLTID